MQLNLSKVEQAFLKEAKIKETSTQIPYITVENFPKLGLFTALRFVEWAAENPNGVISLPTGKTPEYFIKYTQSILKNWDKKSGKEIREKYGLENLKKPDLSGLHFVQIDEFYPINPEQHNSFYNYVMKYYIEGFGLDVNNALLINSDEIPLADGKSYSEVYPDYKIDLSLRFREAKTHTEKLQQESLLMIDDWCVEYEQKIMDKGGIGFFLGGIGPDGHIAFNTRGSDLHSTTRLTPTNFETQAVAAGDLGGIELSKNRLVITIGLGTITYNPDAVAIIFAAGEAKADIVKASIESKPTTKYPATVLQKLKNSKFYLTQGAAVALKDTVDNFYNTGTWTHQKTERAIIDYCNNNKKYGDWVEVDDLKKDKYCKLIPNLDENTVQSVIDSTKAKIDKGMALEKNETICHTGPHHDDVMLGIMPYVTRQLRESSNDIHFSILTSGFTAVTNSFITGLLNDTKRFLGKGMIQMVNYPDFFEEGYKYKWDKDVYHYLDGVAADDIREKKRGICHRIVRGIVSIWGIKNVEDLRDTLNEINSVLRSSYDGGKNPPKIQKLKGLVREFEEELVWAHFGVPVKNVNHMQLGFYKGDVFTENPELKRDVEPILNQLRKIKPTKISLAMDPEGSGPDTHYKVLQAIAAAVKEWGKEEDLSDMKIIGYRNVWFRFHPADVETIFPVSLNALAILDKSFTDCYLSQVNASFPSYQLDGKFSALTQKIWVEQHKQIQYLLGKDYYYQNNHPWLRATHGLVYMRELTVEEFLKEARELENMMEGIAI